jgi:hypothetical protein
MKHCWSLLVGARQLPSARGKFLPTDDRTLQAITSRHFPDGYTILEASGGWFDPARRKFVREQSRQILICGATITTVRRWAREIGEALRQKELLVVRFGQALNLRVTTNAARETRSR